MTVDKPDRREEEAPADATGERAFAPTMIATVAWYVLPAIIYVGWVFSFGASSCDGLPCGRLEQAVRGLSGVIPWAFPSLALSLLVAVLLRLPAVGWRAGATGTAAAILGAGLTTAILRSVGYDIG